MSTAPEEMQPSEEPCLSLARYCHLAGIITESSKGQATVLSSLLLQDGGEPRKTSEFYEDRPISPLILL